MLEKNIFILMTFSLQEMQYLLLTKDVWVYNLQRL